MTHNDYKNQHDIKTKAIKSFRRMVVHGGRVSRLYKPLNYKFSYKQRASEICEDCKKLVVMDYRANYKICPSCKTETPIKI